MAFAMGPANHPQGQPTMSSGTCKASAAILNGSLLIWDTGTLDVGGTNPTAATIAGVAAAAYESAPGYNFANEPASPIRTFAENTIPYYVADTTTLYCSHLVNNSDTYVAPVAANIGVAYGFRKLATGEFAVDKNLTTTNARVTIRRIDTENNLVFWNFLASAIVGV